MNSTNHAIVAVVAAVAFIAFSTGRALAGDAPGCVYLSLAAADRIIYSTQGWGKLGMNTAVVWRGGSPTRLRIKDEEYDRGLGHHANGEIYVQLAGEYQLFEARVGVQWQGGGVGSVVFQVFVDDEKRFETPVMTGSDPAREVRLSVEGAQELRLVASDSGDGITHDCANWVEARLIRDPSAAPQAGAGGMDIAPFARVSSWDPERMDGARAKRTEEYRAEDVFLATEIVPANDGTFTVPVANNGLVCIGLEWAERRFIQKLGLEFVDHACVPATETIQVQYWSGQSAWQGSWKSLASKIEKDDKRLTVRVSHVKNPETRGGVQKIRWIFPAGKKPVIVRNLSAWTASRWDSAKLRVELERPVAGKSGVIEMYNGGIVSPARAGSPLRCEWDLAAPLHIEIRYCRPRPWKTDRTVLRFHLPEAAFGVAVDDILANNGVYIPHAGVFIAPDEVPITLAEHRKRIAGRRTTLQRVREMPDQTFEQAWAKVHNPIQDNGPMLLSLACDNRKFAAYQDGMVTFNTYQAAAQDVGDGRGIVKRQTFSCKLVPQLGSGKGKRGKRHLHGEWLPVPVTTVNEDGVVYRQRTFVAPFDDEPIPDGPGWLYERALCVTECTVHNTNTHDADVSMTFSLFSEIKDNKLAELLPMGKGFAATKDARLLAYVDPAGPVALNGRIQSGAVTFSGVLPVGQTTRYFVYLPAWHVEPENVAPLQGGLKWLHKTESYWQRMLEKSMQVELPDALLTNAIRASQVHCLLAARNEDRGRRVAAWIASDRYGPLESEAHSVIRGMDMVGHREFARRSLEFFVKRYSPEGYLTTGYTTMGTGWHLWTLAEHYERTQDADWLRRIAPEVARVCQWITRQCEKTKRLDAHGEKMPEYGLVPPGVAADWGRYAYRFVQEAHYYAGLYNAARALAEIEHPEAAVLIEEAGQFRENICRAYRWTQARSPVLPLADGTWVPAYPGMLYCFGRIEDIIPGEDGNRSWCYDVELGAHHLAVLRALDPTGVQTAWIADHMEDVWFLHAGMGDYPAEKSRADFFNLGGFSKVQPYYCRIAEIYALRDDVKPFIRAYFNTIPTLLSREILSFWEHFHNIAAWNKTHETGYFLAQTRLMLVMERGDELWLAPLVTNNWLNDGMTIAVRAAPTRFGKVSYSITSSVDRGFVEAVIDPPARRPPTRIVLRLRHPAGKPIKSVTVNGKPHQDFDVSNECIRLEPNDKTIRLRAFY